MKVKDFVEQFSHNNEICVMNKNGFLMQCFINADKWEQVIMDWYIPMSEIAELEFVRIGDVYLSNPVRHRMAFVVDTDKTSFKMIPELCDSPLWLYNETHPDDRRDGECDSPS